MVSKSLYIHIPFCQNICAYCDFCKVFYNENQVNDYLARLKKEIDGLKIDNLLDTIYIGGGTPSSLNDEQLEWLMDIIKPYIHKDIKEVTIEVNPESMDYYKLKILKAGGINRLSIGVETFNDDLLKKINRKHNSDQVRRIINYARKIGFNNISIDLMYGLPNQTIDNIKDDLKVVSELDVEHVSYYALILEDHTVLKNINYQELDEEQSDIINELIDSSLLELGYFQYEISNYSKVGYESLHNLTYWHYNNYYGVGLGASGKIDNYIIEHNRNLMAYLSGKDIIKKIEFTKEETMFNHLMMSLRLVKGLDLLEFELRYKTRLEEVYQDVLNKHLALNTLIIEDGYLHCTKESLRLLNVILTDFI